MLYTSCTPAVIGRKGGPNPEDKVSRSTVRGSGVRRHIRSPWTNPTVSGESHMHRSTPNTSFRLLYKSLLTPEHTRKDLFLAGPSHCPNISPFMLSAASASSCLCLCRPFCWYWRCQCIHSLYTFIYLQSSWRGGQNSTGT